MANLLQQAIKTGRREGPADQSLAAHRSRQMSGDIRRRYLLIRSLKLGFPAAAAVLSLLVIFWPYIAPRPDPKIAFADQSETEEHLRMLHPRFAGTDNQNRDFLILAERATQDTKKSDTVTLEVINADLTATSGEWYSMQAKVGVFDQKQQVLLVSGGFSIFTDKGYEVQGRSGYADMKKTEMKSDEPVLGRGREGRIAANAFHTEDKGKRIFFSKGVRVTFYNGNGS